MCHWNFIILKIFHYLCRDTIIHEENQFLNNILCVLCTLPLVIPLSIQILPIVYSLFFKRFFFFLMFVRLGTRFLRVFWVPKQLYLRTYTHTHTTSLLYTLYHLHTYACILCVLNSSYRCSAVHLKFNFRNYGMYYILYIFCMHKII